MTEAELQSDVVSILELLKKQLRNFEYFSIPNEGVFLGSVGKTDKERYKIYQRILKMGFKTGMPDLCIIGIGRVIFIELKTETGRLSPKQKTRISLINRVGYTTYICKSVGEVKAIILKIYGGMK